jgi:hypothetical protein
LFLRLVKPCFRAFFSCEIFRLTSSWSLQHKSRPAKALAPVNLPFNFFVPELPHSEIPLAAFVLQTVGLSVIAAWLLKHSRGSVLITTLLHGSFNTLGFMTPSIDVATRSWIVGGVYIAAALVITAVYGLQLNRRVSSETPEQLAKAVR